MIKYYLQEKNVTENIMKLKLNDFRKKLFIAFWTKTHKFQDLVSRNEFFEKLSTYAKEFIYIYIYIYIYLVKTNLTLS
jgi:hypothetical protein